LRTIWKYPLGILDSQIIDVPRVASPLGVQNQPVGGRDQLVLWMLVEDEAPKITVEVVVRGTGHEALGLFRSEYVGTAQTHGGAFAWHVFPPRLPGAGSLELP